MRDKSKSNISDQRIVYLDYLRVAAVFAVIVLHTAVQNWHSAGVETYSWRVFNVYDSAVRWCVPVFVMISGAIFVGRDIPVRRIFSKYISRMLCALFFWSAIYAFLFDSDTHGKFMHFWEGHYHLWYIWLITGLYICLPVTNAICAEKRSANYYLLCSLIFAYITPGILLLLNDFGSSSIKVITGIINDDINKMRLDILMGYPLYFILGYALSKTEIKKGHRFLFYFSGFLGFAAICLLTQNVSVSSKTHCVAYYDFTSFNVLLESTAVFLWFSQRKYNRERLNAIFRKLSECCFGVYLVHPMILDALDRFFGVNTNAFDPILSVIIISVLTAVFSFAVSLVLNSIPFIKNRFV